MGTVELTGLEMMRKHAFGQLLEHCSAMPLTIEALVLNRSSLCRESNECNSLRRLKSTWKIENDWSSGSIQGDRWGNLKDNLGHHFKDHKMVYLWDYLRNHPRNRLRDRLRDHLRDHPLRNHLRNHLRSHQQVAKGIIVEGIISGEHHWKDHVRSYPNNHLGGRKRGHRLRDYLRGASWKGSYQGLSSEELSQR